MLTAKVCVLLAPSQTNTPSSQERVLPFTPPVEKPAKYPPNCESRKAPPMITLEILVSLAITKNK